MEQKEAFDKINGMLAETDYPVTISSLEDISDFLMDDSNRRFTEEYPVMGRVYDDLSGRPDVDRYPEPAVGKDHEEQKYIR
jgi:hypothetical protein